MKPRRKSNVAPPSSAQAGTPDIGRFRAQHLSLGRLRVETPHGAIEVSVDESESPLAWLARRKGRDGRALIEANQFLAGERLRAEFTRAQLMPRTTANWHSPVAGAPRGTPHGSFSEIVVASRQRVRQALDASGPEFSGLLVDVCCFLKTLPEVERDRGWPSRSAKVVLQLGLDRLARHYGIAAAAHGARQSPLRTWLAGDAEFVVAEYETG